MQPIRLAHLINEVAEGIERSRLEGIHCKDKDGNVLRDSNGFPFYNMVSTQLLNTIIHAEIIRKAIYED